MRKIALFAATAILAACSTGGSLSDSFDSRTNVGVCPPAGSIYQASRIVEMEGEGIGFSNIQYTGEIVDVRLFCRYAGSDPVEAEIEIDFAFGQGPKASSDQHDYTYWVAITRRSGKVLGKQYFTARADFNDGPIVAAEELLQDIVIPRADESVSAANFEVLVGFDLTEEQLAFNKDGRRFRLNAGQ